MDDPIVEQGRVAAVLARLREAYPDAGCSLIFQNPFQLLIATILAAQCTDERVNSVTPLLFQRYPTPEALAAAPLPNLEEAVRPTGFYRNKARNIQATARILAERFGGQVPPRMEDLQTLPGAARKTANVVLGDGFGIVQGVVVDTHAGRISRRLGLTAEQDPAKIEQDLMRVLPREEWLHYTHRLIAHGRAVCRAQRPRCGQCNLAELCPSAGQVDA